MVEDELSSDEKSTLFKQFEQEEKKLNIENPLENNLDLLKEMEQLIGSKKA